MNHILEDFFRYHISPGMQFAENDIRYKKVLEQFVEMEVQLLQALPLEKHDLLTAYTETQLTLEQIVITKSQVYAFKLAALMFAEIFLTENNLLKNL